MIVLDTHVWIWWVSNPDLIVSRGQDVIDEAVVEKKIYISSTSVWEVI